MSLPSYYKFWQPNTDLNFDTDIMSGYKKLNSMGLGLGSNKPSLPTKSGLGSVLGIAGGVAGGLMDLYQGLNADTSEIDNAVDRQIDALGNLKYNKADSIDELMANQSAYRGLEANHTADEFYKGPSDGELFTNALAKGASSALSTSSAGPIASAISGGLGFLGSLAGGIFGRKAQRRAASAGASELNTEERRKNAYMDLAFRNDANNINTINNRTLMSQVGISAYGGPLGVSLTPVNGAIDFMQNEELLSSLGEDTTKNNNRRTSMPMFAFGGALGGYGGDWSNGLTYIGAGGSHEENPLGGVPAGMSQDGRPNQVEEGEYIWTDQDYVFSKRIEIPEEEYEALGLKKGKRKLTYADGAEILQKESSERPNDPISERGKNAALMKLMQSQEQQRALLAQQEQQEQIEYAMGGGLSRDKDYGSKKKPYPKVKDKDFAGGGRSYPIPTKADAIDALRLAGLHGRSDVKAKVYKKYPELKHSLGGYIFDNGGPKDKLAKVVRNSNKQPVRGTWNGLYDWMVNDIPLVQQIPMFGGFGGSDSFGGSGASGEWGNIDYVRNILIPPTTETFDEAFARHRKAGDKVWEFDGKLYNSEIDPNYKGSPNGQRTQVVTPAMNIRDVFTNTGERVVDSTKIEPYYGQPQGYTERETLAPNKVKYKYIGSSPFKALGGHLFDWGGVSSNNPYGNMFYTPSIYKPSDNIPYINTDIFNNATRFSTNNGIFNRGFLPNANVGINYTIPTSTESSISNVGNVGTTNGTYLIPDRWGSELQNMLSKSWNNSVSGRSPYINEFNTLNNSNLTWSQIRDVIASNNYSRQDNSIIDMPSKKLESSLTFPTALPKEYNFTLAGTPTKQGDTEKGAFDPLPTSGWQTSLRYLPAIAPAISLGYSLFKKPDYGYADELDAAGNAYAEAIREGGKVTPKFIGDYLAYNPFDRIFYANELGAQQAANRSAIMNAGNANRGATMAALLGSGYNDNVGLGKLFREGDEYNLAQRQKVAEFNRGTNQYNSTLDMQAQEINARKNERLAAALLNNKYRSLAMKQAIDSQRDQNISLALTNLFNNLGDIGWEAKQGYWNNALINSGYYGTPNASMYDIAYGANGGKLKRKKKRGLTI